MIPGSCPTVPERCSRDNLGPLKMTGAHSMVSGITETIICNMKTFTQMHRTSRSEERFEADDDKHLFFTQKGTQNVYTFYYITSVLLNCLTGEILQLFLPMQ